jgi:hypothetical protein
MGKPNQKADMDPSVSDDEAPKYKVPYKHCPSYQDYNEIGQGNPGKIANRVNDRGYKEYR